MKVKKIRDEIKRLENLKVKTPKEFEERENKINNLLKMLNSYRANISLYLIINELQHGDVDKNG